MNVTVELLIRPVLIGSTPQLLYATSQATTARIDKFSVRNGDDQAHTISVYIKSVEDMVEDGNAVLLDFTVPAETTIELSQMRHVVPPGFEVFAAADVAGELLVIASGVLFSP